MISCIPQQRAAEFVDHDLWRICTFDGLTHLSRGYSSTQWLFEPVSSEFLRPLDEWLEWKNGTLTPDLAASRFDRVIIPRLSAVFRQLLAQGMSNLLMETQHEPFSTKFPWVQLSDLDLLQLSQAFDSVARPLLDWPEGPNAKETLRKHLKLSAKETADLQLQLKKIWAERYKRLWADGPRAKGHQSTLTRVMAHICRTTVSLRKTWHRSSIYSIPHRNVLALFTGFYFSELPLEHSWKNAGEAIGADPIGQWFWPTWERILNTMEDSSISTFSGFD